ncbi:MAG: PKD domain-containing protein [Candidatus Woesearchaeota archaeon]
MGKQKYTQIGRQKDYKTLLWIIILSIISIILITPIVSSQNILIDSILIENNTSIVNATIIIDSASLNLTTNNLTNYTQDNASYTIDDVVQNEVSYDCEYTDMTTIYLSGQLLNESAFHKISSSLQENIYLIQLDCDYEILENHTITSTTIIGNETIINTSQYGILKTLELSTDTTITIDVTAPTISVQELNNSINISVQDLTQTNCEFIIDDIENGSGFNHSESFTNELYYLINTNITSNKTFNYSISCIDSMNNTANYTGSINIIYTPHLFEEQSFFDISLSKTSFSLGEIGYYTIHANNNSNVSITICPVSQGWVQCYVSPEYINDIFPIQEFMPYNNKTGRYSIEGIMRFKNNTLRLNKTFEVINTLDADIDVSINNPAIGDMVTFNATASGGIGSYIYKWVMHDGQVFNGRGAYKAYSSPGDYKVNLSVNDSAGNSYFKSINVEVRDKYSLKIITIDKNTGSRMQGVYIQADDYNGTTNGNGELTLKIPEGVYDIYASKNEYGAMMDNLDLDENTTLYMNMSFDDDSAPVIHLLTTDESVFSKDAVKLKFKASDETDLYCELYIAETNSSWYSLKDYGDNLLVDTEYTFEISDLESGAYNWKISCTDENDNSDTSDVRNFVITDEYVASQLKTNSNNYDNINSALDRIYSLSGPESEVVELLGIKQSLKTMLEKSNTLDRDIHNLAFRRDLDEQGRQDAEKKLINDIEELKKTTPVNVEILDSKTFVKYVRDEDLKALISEYVSIKSMKVNEKLLLEAIKRTQSKAIISTKIRNVALYYTDGRVDEITLVTKDISIPNSEDESLFKSNTVSFVEVIPKELASSITQVNILTKDYVVLKADPMIEFPSDTKIIAYYFDGSIDLDAFEKLDTVIIDKNIKIDSPTGFAILGMDSVADITFDGKTILILIIVLLFLVYLFMNFDIYHKVVLLFSNSKKKISYIRVLVNDALDNIAVNEYDKASLIYREIKLNYETSPESIQKEVYDECYDLCNRLDVYYFNELYDEAKERVKYSNIITFYDRMYMTFSKIDDKYKSELQDKLESIKQEMNRYNSLK